MPASNKKKKKATANPARTVLTTSIQSKSKIEKAPESEVEDASGTSTPAKALNIAAAAAPSISNQEPDLRNLSPVELEAQLETSELQQFVETHAAKVKREASRQASKLQTEKRLLRGQADFLSTKYWLPDELMQQILDAIVSDSDHERASSKKQDLPVGDELVIKIWTLRLALLELEIPLVRVNEAIESVLRFPTPEDSSTYFWGLSATLDWLALQCDPDEIREYDAQKHHPVGQPEESTADSQSEIRGEAIPQKAEKLNTGLDMEALEPSNNGHANVSDVESDVEPEELLAIYLRTKARLYEINPGKETSSSHPSKSRDDRSIKAKAGVTVEEQKLKQKLKKIESDVLFDQREADSQWSTQRISLAKETAQRRRLNLETLPQMDESQTSPLLSNGIGDSKTNHLSANENGRHSIDGEDDSDDSSMIGGMFDSIPGASADADVNEDPTASGGITIRDFGRVAGMTPRRVLDETCRSRDSRCRISFQQVSATTYSCRHRVTIEWTTNQDVPESAYMPSLLVKGTSRQLNVTMMKEATPDVLQSESYSATAALFLIFSELPKEEKSHLRLPPAFRDLWDEFSQLKRGYTNGIDREMVKELRSLVEPYTKPAEDSEDEVVFNAASRRLNGSGGTSTPASRPLTPRPVAIDSDQSLKDVWMRKSSSSSYQRMLVARTNLPVFHARTSILEAIWKNQITIVVGDTGSGKSTQLPQFILENELSNGRACKVYCTQPRRISAISLAQRVSEELGEHKNDVGTNRSLVGYAIRLESHTTAHTKLVYATVGIVLRMLESSDGLGEITHLVLDEVHERNIDTDFLLIVVRSLLIKRPDLKVVLMSATVDAQKFSRYLDNAPIISVPGRTFPVQSMFLEDAIELTGYSGEGDTNEATEDVDEADKDSQDASKEVQQLTAYTQKTKDTLRAYDEYKIDHGLILALIEMVAYDPRYIPFSQAILIFVPGIQEIRRLNDILLGHPSFAQGWRVHALHSTFSSEDQQAAFDIPSNGVRKIVIATNIAETGITIPDITCVIDTGKHREMRFDERRQMSRLTQSFIAKANAKQRRGRAGRVQEGICFHLFTKYRFENLMAEQQTPEMLRLSLQDLVMRVKICKLGEIESALSQALDPPSSKNIRRAIDALTEVGALTSSEQLTALGSQLAKLPLDAQLGKLILYGETFGCLDFALTVAAALGAKSPFLAPMYAKKQADTVRLGFKRGDSDLLTLYNAYTAWRKVCTTPGLSEFHFCNKNFLSAQNLANIEDLKAQLLISLTDAGIVSLDAHERTALMRVRPGSRQRNFVTLPGRYSANEGGDEVASSVAAWSFYPKIIKRDGKGWRNIANNQSLALHPTSVNKHSLPSDIKYLSFYSIMQSSSRFTNAQETTAVSDVALVLLAGDAVFHMYAGVIVVDGNRLKFKVRDWKTMLALKHLRTKVKKALERGFKCPGRELGERNTRWLEIVGEMFRQRVP